MKKRFLVFLFVAATLLPIAMAPLVVTGLRGFLDAAKLPPTTTEWTALLKEVE